MRDVGAARTTSATARSTRSRWSARSPARPRSTSTPCAWAARCTAMRAGWPQCGEDRSIASALPQHAHRLHRARRARRLHRRGHVAHARAADGQEGLPRRRRGWPHTFDLLRANDLIFSYVVNNWLLGKDPPAFDLLAWNNDSTRMPAKMHSAYLRSCYLEQRVRPRRVRGRRPPLRPVKVESRHLRARGRRRPHRAVASRSSGPRVLGGKTVRAQHLGTHRRHREPARAQSAKHWTNDHPEADPILARRRHAARGDLVGGVVALDWRPRRRPRRACAAREREVPAAL